MAEKNVSAAQTAQKFPIERLAKACRTLFHVSASTFAGATAGMTGEYTVEEMRKHIDEWLRNGAVVLLLVGKKVNGLGRLGRARPKTFRVTANTPLDTPRPAQG